MSANETAKKPRGKPFPPGNKANPHGRPRGSRNLAVRVLDAIGNEASEEILRVVVKKARGGNLNAAAIVLRHVWPEPKGRLISLDLPAVTDAEAIMRAIAAVVAAVGRGEMTTDEGQAFVAMFDGQRRCLETVELAARMTAVEAELRKSK